MQTIIAIVIIIAAAAYAVYLTAQRLRHPGDCGCGRGHDCPYKKAGKSSCPDCKSEECG